MKALGIVILTILFIIFLLFGLLAQAPDTLWTRTYGGLYQDFAGDVEVTADSGYIVVGMSTIVGGNGDCYVVKTNSAGDILWTQSYGGANYDCCWSIRQCEDLGYIMSGETKSFSADSQDLYLVRTDAIGDTLWTRIYGGIGEEFGACVQRTLDSSYIVVGKTSSFGAGMDDVWLLKIDRFGNIEWEKTYGGAVVDVGISVEQTTDSGFIIAGYTVSVDSFDSADVYVIKTDKNGDTLWTRTFGGDCDERGQSVQLTADGGFILAGYTSSYGSGLTDIYLIKLNSIGDTLWTKAYGGSDLDQAYCIRETSNGDFIIAGVTGTGNADVLVVRTDKDGNVKWTKTIGDSTPEIGQSVRETADGGFIIAGWDNKYGQGMEDYYLIRLAPDVGIQDSESNKRKGKIQVLISPNPFTSMTNIRLIGTSKHRPATLTIYDSAGRFVKLVKLETSTYQLGTDLKAGIYFLKLNSKAVGKVVKVK